MFRVLVICGCLLAVAQAGVIGGGLLAAPGGIAVQPSAVSLPAGLTVPTLAATSSNIIRGIGNLGAISADSKSIDTPFSSVRKADVRVTNPGILVTSAVQTPIVAVNNGLAGPFAAASIAGPTLIGPSLTSAIAAGPGIATTGIAVPHGINGLTLNGIGGFRIL